MLEGDGLAEFSRLLSVFVHCNRLDVVASLPAPPPAARAASILSSIEFDGTGARFATAGVGKRVCVYDFQAVLDGGLDGEGAGGEGDGDEDDGAATAAPSARPGVQPAVQLTARSKLSCLSWSRHSASHLVASDYDGCACLWDVAAGKPVAEYDAHDRRVWSVDFCPADGSLFATGSDDGYAKVWAVGQQAPAIVLGVQANVCCAKYDPSRPHELAVGAADHCVHMYDLRRPTSPLHSLSGHRKAVSYVRFGAAGLVSASTDSSLRLWAPPSGAPARRC